MRYSLCCGMYNCFPNLIFCNVFCKTIEVRHTSRCFLLFVASVTLNILLKYFSVRNEQLKFIFNNPWSSRSSPVCTAHSAPIVLWTCQNQILFQRGCYWRQPGAVQTILDLTANTQLSSKSTAKRRYLCHVCRGRLHRLLKGTATKKSRL